MTKYFADPASKNKKEERAYLDRQNTTRSDQNSSLLTPIIFAAAYIALLIIVGILYGLNYENPQYNVLFNSWQQFTASNVIKLVCAIALSFFFPGYAIITIILDKTRQDLRLLPKILLGYILSIGIVGFFGYITALMDFAVSDVKLVLVFVNVLIIALFVQQLDVIPTTRSVFSRSRKNQFSLAKVGHKFSQSLPEVFVFGSLLGLVVLSSYVLYNGVMVGDQWFHHGRALQFISGNYDAITTSHTDYLYPPLLSAFLSSFFVLADVPTVNAYASIGFLNIVSVFAFYYFLQNWIPIRRKKSALLAASLFVLSSGFGWIFAINAFVDSTAPPSQNSALHSILEVSKQTFDIRSPSTFLLASHPDISTGLQLIALPIGFVLLGIVKDENVKPKYRSYVTVIVTAILLVGIFSHDEIYFFIIIACLLPIVFGLRGKGFIYLGLLSANGIAIFANYIFLQDFLSATVIMGIPLIIISFFFIMIVWAMYSSRILEKLYHAIGTHIATINRAFSHENSEPYRSRSKFILSVILVSVVAYLYLFSYITWAELSVKDVEIQTSEGFPRNVPWYLYPMKLGLIGILGMCFVLSYIFRRFEKEVFVFGIIIIVAIITGPYYDEHRFNKYVMVGLVGFASLFIYDVIVFINKKFHYGILLSGIFVGGVIVLSSFSTLMFVGFQAASIDTDNLDFLWEGRRNFPLPSELQVLQFLRNYITSNFNSPGVYNIVTWPNEYQLKLGLIGKFEGFLGLPIPKMLQSPLALNASSLESFYNLLSKSDARFIVVSTPGIVNKSDTPSSDSIKLEKVIEDNKKNMKAVQERKQEVRPIIDPTDIQDFALVNFDKIYQDGKFVVLSVPNRLTPPSTSGDNAMILSGSGEVLTDPNNPSVMVTLPYTNKFYNKIDDSDFAKIGKDKGSLLLNTYNKSQTLWSRDIEYQNGNLDYIEAKFMTIDQNRNKENIECGIIWEGEGEKKYYVRIKDDKLEFSETPATKDRFNFENLQVKLNEWVPYTLKLMFSDSTLDVYVDDMLGLQVPTKFYQGYNANTMSRIGIRCSGNIAEFNPIKIAQIDQPGSGDLEDSRKRQQNYEYYYPLTMLALSGAGYDTFLPNDNSIFSKDNILMTTRTFDNYYENNDKVNNKVLIDRFLDYVKRGGTLTIFDTENPIDGWFEEAFSIKSISDKNSEFNSVVKLENPTYTANLSGTIPRIGTTSPEVAIKSYYQMDNQRISPFAMEKNYGKGKIILVNAAGFFDAVSQEPQKYFSKLEDTPILVGIISDSDNKNKTNTKLTPISHPYNLGKMRITGTSAINGSSLLLPFGSDNTTNRYSVEDISILTNNTGGGNIPALSTKVRDADNNNSITEQKSELRGDRISIAKNTLIKNLELQGLYNVTLNSEGTIQLPSPTAPYSKSNYASLSIPSGFDMEISLSNDSSTLVTLANGTEITVETNGSNNGKVKAGDKYDGTQIYVHNIRNERAHGNPVSILMKRPQILADGNATFDSLFQGSQDFDVFKGIEGNLFETRNDSRLDLKLDYIDSYYSSSNRKQTEDYVTYIDLVNVERTSNSTSDLLAELRIPGDISDTAKQDGIGVPWEKAFFSVDNAIALIFFVVAAGLITLLMWPRFRNQIKASG